MADPEKFGYALICNIPSFYHSRDLRTFFQDMIERNYFDCFHFRHRPDVSVAQNKGESTKNEDKTFCCMVRMEKKFRSEFMSKFHGAQWKKVGGTKIGAKCVIVAIKIAEESKSTNIAESSPQIQNQSNSLTVSSLNSLVELRPPSLMRQGNVGTPTKHFLQMINDCTLPPKIVKNLGLTFPKSGQSRVYSKVGMDYVEDKREKSIEDTYLDSQMDDCDLGEDNDKDQCEEWERHEALHEDCGKQDRLGERLFEQEMEVVWDKGGSGLVFYTDAFYWDQMKGTDTDERWTDDWDVDTTVFYPDPHEASTSRLGDMDSRDMQDIRSNLDMDKGKLTVPTVFKKKDYSTRKRPYSKSTAAHANKEAKETFAHFTKYSKGIGKKLMEERGWKEGQGLGIERQGKPLPISVEEEGQGPNHKTGFGYSGEKLQRFGLKKPEQKYNITTVYDNFNVQDPKHDFLRNKELSNLKHR